MSSDFKYSTDFRHGGKRKYTIAPNKPYDWKSNGVISRTSPAFLVKSNNPILTRTMQFIDMWIMTLLLSIEKVAKFKNFMEK